MFEWFKRGKAGNIRPSESQSLETDSEGVAPVIQDRSPHFSTDAPLATIAEDKFDRAPFARRIAKTIADRSDSACLVVALYGPWGDGKTTTLHFLSHALSDSRDVIPISFNPWRVNGEDALLQSFFSTLAEALEVELKTSAEKIGKLLKDYSFLLKPVPTIGAAVSAVEGVGAALSSVSLEALRKRIGNALRETRKRLVIIIDDIDRLDKTEIQALFRLVKLTGDFDNVVYVLAFDEAMVAAALGERFASVPSEHLSAGQHFLEKIVQVGLHLPPTTAENLREYLYGILNTVIAEADVTMTQDQSNILARGIEIGILPRLKTPRMVNRYANAVRFSLGLMRGEVDPSDLVLLEGLRTFYPSLYDAVRRNKELLLSSRDRDRKGYSCDSFVSENSKGLSTVEQAAACSLLIAVFPRAGTTGYGSDWENTWFDAKKVCSDAYFDRYFSYAIRATDFSDLTVLSLLREAETASITDEVLGDKLGELLTEANAGKLIQKLRSVSSKLPASTALRIARMIAANSSKLPNRETALSYFSTPFLQAAILIRHLVLRAPAPDRLDAAREVILSIATVPFIAEVVRWLSSGKEDKDKAFSEAEEDLLRLAGGERILHELQSAAEPIFVMSPKDASHILSILTWAFKDEQIAKDYIMTWLHRSTKYLEPFLISFLPTAWSLETGIPHTSDLSREGYDHICKLADVDYVRTSLRELLGDELNQPEYHMPQDVSLLRRVAHQFTHIDNQVVAASEPKIDEEET